MKYHEIITALGGRKFLIALAMLAVTFAFIAFGFLSEDVGVELVKWLGVAYLGANAAAKITNRLAGIPGPEIQAYIHSDELDGERTE